jgi:hypothetical protein
MIICLLCVVVLIGCANQKLKKWDWKPHSYGAYSDTQTLEDAHGDIVSCSNERFDAFTAFPDDNIAELKVNIEKMKDNQKNHKASLLAIRTYLQEKEVMTPELEQYFDMDNLKAIDRGLEDTLNLLE